MNSTNPCGIGETRNWGLTMGKKKKENNRRRNNTLMVMLDDAEKAFVREKAESYGMTMSSYARFSLLLGMDKVKPNDGK